MKIWTEEAALELARTVGHAAMQFDSAQKLSETELAIILSGYVVGDRSTLHAALVRFNAPGTCTNVGHCEVDKLLAAAVEALS